MKIKPLLFFSARCSAAATLSYFIANLFTLSFPVWASMSALIVSQERFQETRRSLIGRILGTLLGVVIALGINLVVSFFPMITMPLEMAISVAICAAIAHIYPSLRVSMWTTPVVLLTATPEISIFTTGFYRGSEVIVGSLIGGICHAIAVRMGADAEGRPSPMLHDD